MPNQGRLCRHAGKFPRISRWARTVHTDGNLGIFQQRDDVDQGELGALVCVEYLWPAVARHGIFYHLDAKRGFEVLGRR